jgi:hypothetical protein
MEVRIDNVVVNGNNIISVFGGSKICGWFVFDDQIIQNYHQVTHSSSTLTLEFESFVDSPPYD